MIQECACGHPQGDHASGRAVLATVYGICLAPGCGCREFTLVEPAKVVAE